MVRVAKDKRVAVRPANRESVIPQDSERHRVRSTTGRFLLWTLGCLLFAAAAVTAALTASAAVRQSISTPEVALVSLKLAVLLAPSLALLWIAWRMDADRSADVVWWGVLVGAAVTAASLVTGIEYLEPTAATTYPLLVQVLTGASVGCLLGVIIGGHETDARANAAKAAENAQVARERREDFVFLNQLLRHHVLNAVTIIRGRAGLLEDELEDDESAHVTAIRQRSDRIAALVGTVQTVSNALAAESETEPVDVVTILEDVVAEYRDAYPDATIRVDASDDLVVASNGALHVVFDQLVENAIEHNTGTPEVTIDVGARERDTVVTVADDGEGFTERERETAFEAGDAGDSGFGLYAVNVLVTDCGGDVDIRDRDEGSAVVVTLPTP